MLFLRTDRRPGPPLWSVPPPPPVEEPLQSLDERRCHYCHMIFDITIEGAMFGEIAACRHCEQHLTRDVVLPALESERKPTLRPRGDSENDDSFYREG